MEEEQQCDQDSIEKKKGGKMGGCINQAGTGQQDQAALDGTQCTRLLGPAARPRIARQRARESPPGQCQKLETH